MTDENGTAAPTPVRERRRRMAATEKPAFNPLRATGFDNPRPTGDGDSSGRYAQQTYDPDDPQRQMPSELKSAVAEQAREDDARRRETENTRPARRRRARTRSAG